MPPSCSLSMLLSVDLVDVPWESRGGTGLASAASRPPTLSLVGEEAVAVGILAEYPIMRNDFREAVNKMIRLGE